jgi:anti-sigma factor RsiW
MTRHPVILALIEKRLRGETTEAENARLAAHLARCPDCREESEAAQFVDRVFRRLLLRKAGARYQKGFEKKRERMLGEKKRPPA